MSEPKVYKMSSATEYTKLRKCPGKDSFQRMNYLYQVCNDLATKNEANHTASALYGSLLVHISKKAVQRLDVDLKRTICKGCNSILLSGITSKTRIKKKKLIVTCLKCNTSKSFCMKNSDYQPWIQKQESVEEILDYKTN